MSPRTAAGFPATVKIDAVAIYRNSFAGAIALVCGWLAARSLLGVFPSVNVGLNIGQGAVIGIALALAVGLCSSGLRWTALSKIPPRAAIFCFVGAVCGALASAVRYAIYQSIGGSFALMISWVLMGVAVCVAVAIINKNVGRWPRSLLAGVVGGLVGGSTFEAAYSLFMSSEIRPDLAMAMAGVYGLGLYGALICGLDRLADDYFRTACISLETGRNAGRSTTLDTRKRKLQLGSARDCDVRLIGDKTVAPHHAAIARKEDDYVLEAIDGVTFAGPDGEAPSPAERHVLADGDIICVGIHRIRFGRRQVVH